ncbi:MAG: transcriptional repressor LexA [Pseudomonadota bacterium]
MLTKKQHQLLMFIHERVKDTGVSPSFEEMKEALDLRSKSGIHRLITALEERGFLRRLPHRARALEIVRLPDDIETKAQSSLRPRPKVVVGDFSKSSRPAGEPQTSALAQGSASEMIPVLGRIAAGTPIEAIQHEVDQVPAPSTLLGAGEHYALEVQGDSMIEAGIHDGDIVFIRKAGDAANGEIVVALVDDQEATLKRLRKKGAAIALEPANETYETRIYGAERVAIQGKLAGLFRKY